MGVPDNRSDKVPTTWTLRLVVAFLLDFFMHNSFIVFAYIGYLECLGGKEFLCTDFVTLPEYQSLDIV